MIVCGDFETYYDKEFSLSKMSTEEYVRSQRFEVIGYAQSIDGQAPTWDSGYEATAARLKSIDWSKAIFVAHNARFDAMILYHHFGIVPALIVDTMSMARAAGLGNIGSVNLATLSNYLIEMGAPIAPKGSEVANHMGRRFNMFTPSELYSYGEYAKTDAYNAYVLFQYLRRELPSEELVYQHNVLCAGVYPRIKFDGEKLAGEKQRLDALATTMLSEAATRMQLTSADEVRTIIRSKIKFRFVLEALGGALSEDAIWSGSFGEYGSYKQYLMSRCNGHFGDTIRFIIPTKVSDKQSATAGRMVYTLAASKTDAEFSKLVEGDDEDVAFFCSLKLGLSSSIMQTRTERMLAISRLGGMGVPINIAGAHTQRMSGADKLNLQNLPSGRKEGQSPILKKSVMVPFQGFVMVGGDASQIEARLNAYISNERELLHVFATGGDPYSMMASKLYHVDALIISKGNKDGVEMYVLYRQMGKAQVLGCGYRMGEARFRDAARENYGLILTAEEAKAAVTVYRQTNANIAAMWKYLDELGRVLTQRNRSGYFGGPNGNLFYYDTEHTVMGKRLPGIRLPDGLWVVYPDIRFKLVEDKVRGGMKEQLVCTRSRGRATSTVNLHGGIILENITQALAFAVGKWQMRGMCSEGFAFVMNEHDAWMFLAPEDQADHAAARLKHWLGCNPPWLPDCPLSSGVGYAYSLGDIKNRRADMDVINLSEVREAREVATLSKQEQAILDTAMTVTKSWVDDYNKVLGKPEYSGTAVLVVGERLTKVGSNYRLILTLALSLDEVVVWHFNTKTIPLDSDHQLDRKSVAIAVVKATNDLAERIASARIAIAYAAEDEDEQA